MSNIFHFKYFDLLQEKSAQKMTTDSMLLGAVAGLEGAMNILDIGTGTGVLALMMAQKHSEALIDAVEIDPDSAEEAAGNFAKSPWDFRMNVYSQSLSDFVADETLHYDLILSNPPYFDSISMEKGNNTEWPDNRRLDARTQSALNFDILLDAVAKILVSYGRFYVILPVQLGNEFVEKAKSYKLHLVYHLNIAHQSDQKTHRLILGFQKESAPFEEESLFLRDDEGNWSKSYLKLTANFHNK